MHKISIYGIAVLTALYSCLAVAENSAYQVEAIIFAQNMPTTEVFDQNSSRISWPSDLTELSAYKKPEQTTLDESYNVLSHDSTYQLISHIAWIQQLNNGEQAAPVHIQNNKNELDGYIQIHRTQGLQITVDLEFTTGQAGTLIYRLNEKQSIKLNEIYYIDHPKFGVLIKVSNVSSLRSG